MLYKPECVLMQTIDIFNVLVQLLRMSMGCEPVATVQLTARQWRELYRMACQQTLVGVVPEDCFVRAVSCCWMK